MATVHELIEGLQKTGTGERKIRALEGYADTKPNASANEAVEWMRSEWTKANLMRTVGNMSALSNDFEKETGIGQATITKADHIAKGKPLDDLMGKPPKDAKESEMRKLAAVVGTSVVQALAEEATRKGEQVKLSGTAAAVAKR